MEFIGVVIIFAVLVTLSNILSKVFPVIPIFMIQIFLGIMLGLTHIGQSLTFEPEMFLVMIIAPLLFREGEQADIPSILKNFGTILFLAFGGVLLTLFGVGVTLKTLLPDIPYAACFAFGAALGPTDAVAVGSLAKRLKLPKNELHILEGEGLLNDASGVTAFQFALTALLTGAFSPLHASLTLVVSSIGGALVGYVIVWLKKRVIQLIERASAQDVTAYLLIELLLPFLAYVLAESFHVSGIIAAVVSGVLQASGLRKINVFDAELSNVSESTWTTVGFMLNALVFLFLGIEISQVFSPIWQSTTYSNPRLLVVVLVIAMLLFLLRFLFISFFYMAKEGRRSLQRQFKNILLLTFGGVKGTVSVATIFILPVTINGILFPQRAVLLFLTACVVLVSLTIGMVVLPFLSEGEPEAPLEEKGVSILEEVIMNLRQDLNTEELTEEEQIATEAVIETYQSRVIDLYTSAMTESEQQELQEIQGLILSIERDNLDESFRKGKISPNGYRFYSRYFTNVRNSLTRQLFSFLAFWLLFVKRLIRIALHPKLFVERLHQNSPGLKAAEVEEIKQVFASNNRKIIQSLENLKEVYEPELIDFFIAERKNLAVRVEQGNMIRNLLIQQDAAFAKRSLRGYYLERKIIDEYEVAGEITTFLANDYRQKVNTLESYAISQLNESPPLRFVLRKKSVM